MGSILSVVLLQINYGIDFNNLNYGSIPSLFFVSGIIGVCSIIGILKYMDYNCVNFKYIEFLGVNSLFIMCTHLPFYIASIISLYMKRLCI